MRFHAILFWFIVLANIGGAVFGFVFYYGEQYLATSPLLWLFVGDCPLYALAFAVAFFFRGEERPESLKAMFGKIPDLSIVWFIALVGAVKYGFWTVFVLSAYSQFYFTPEAGLLYTVLFGSHLILLFETVLLVGKVRVRDWFPIVSILWFLANDLSDYLLGTHPPLPQSALGFMFPATIAMTIVFSALGYVTLMRYSKEFRG